MMSYPQEKDKGKFIAIFWALFNCGGILGSLIALVMNLENNTGGVSTGTYTAFVIVMLIGVALSLILANPVNVVRADGSCVSVAGAAHWTTELRNVLKVWQEWRMIALIPAFLASNWFYAYQFRINSLYFDPSTRALNDLVYWAMQVVGSIMMGYFLDYKGLARRTRGLVALGFLFSGLMAIWAGGFAFQTSFDADYSDPIRWTNSRFGGPFVLYIMYGFSDSIYQTYLYWLMGAMSNDPALLARYAGFYKAMQSAGAAIAFGIDSSTIRLRWECLICWALVVISFPLIFSVANRITETSAKPLCFLESENSTDQMSTTFSVDEKPKTDNYNKVLV